MSRVGHDQELRLTGAELVAIYHMTEKLAVSGELIEVVAALRAKLRPLIDAAGKSEAMRES